jgi:hypothetical protein
MVDALDLRRTPPPGERRATERIRCWTSRLLHVERNTIYELVGRNETSDASRGPRRTQRRARCFSASPTSASSRDPHPLAEVAPRDFRRAVPFHGSISSRCISCSAGRTSKLKWRRKFIPIRPSLESLVIDDQRWPLQWLRTDAGVPDSETGILRVTRVRVHEPDRLLGYAFSKL